MKERVVLFCLTFDGVLCFEICLKEIKERAEGFL